MVAQMQPYGHFITTYDALGGAGLIDQVYGDHRTKSMDIIGLKYAYPNNPSINLVYRQFIERPYLDSSDGTWKTEVSARVDKIKVRDTYENDLLSLLIMAPEYKDGDFATQKAAAMESGLDFAGTDRGLVISFSDQTQQALQWQFHARQDLGGHTAGDRNNFMLSGKGRIWIRLPKVSRKLMLLSFLLSIVQHHFFKGLHLWH